MLLKIEYKAIKIAATFPLKTKRFQLLFLYFQNKWMPRKKWATMRQPLPLLCALFASFFPSFGNEMQPNKLKNKTELRISISVLIIFYSIWEFVFENRVPTTTVWHVACFEPFFRHALSSFNRKLEEILEEGSDWFLAVDRVNAVALKTLW